VKRWARCLERSGSLGQAALMEQAAAAAEEADEDGLPHPPPNGSATWQELLRRWAGRSRVRVWVLGTAGCTRVSLRACMLVLCMAVGWTLLCSLSFFCCNNRCCHRYCLLSRSSLRVSESQLQSASPDAYATMSDDLIMVHAAVELGNKVRTALHAAPVQELVSGAVWLGWSVQA
jgi:hypothetical protein